MKRILCLVGVCLVGCSDLPEPPPKFDAYVDQTFEGKVVEVRELRPDLWAVSIEVNGGFRRHAVTTHSLEKGDVVTMVMGRAFDEDFDQDFAIIVSDKKE